MRYLNFSYLLLFLLLLGCLPLRAIYPENMLNIFPMEKYNQEVKTWINPKDSGYNLPLISLDKQSKRLDEYKQHYFSDTNASTSPWNVSYVSKVLAGTTAEGNLFHLEQSYLEQFSNLKKPSNLIGYGTNFRPYTQKWITDITTNVNISQFKRVDYVLTNRAIAVNNLGGRQLPTDDPFFYTYKIAGEGYPFDNLQQSAIWAGTPLYIIGTTVDKSWSLVLTPDFIAWVHSEGIARVTGPFIKTWQRMANQSSVALIKISSITDSRHVFQFNAYIGSVFPGLEKNGRAHILIPVADRHRNAIIEFATLDNGSFAVMPLRLTRHNLSLILTNLIGRAYGWGNMSLYNDCSAELKALFTPFGIYLARNANDQPKSGKTIDLSHKSALEREQYLMQDGHPWVTLVHIPGHILLYIGNFPNPNSAQHESIAMSYQNVWGLHPRDNSFRAVIGGAVFLPLLMSYPEDLKLASFYDPKIWPVFQLSYLDESSD